MTPTQVDRAGVGSVSIRGANLVSPGRAIKLTAPADGVETRVVSSASATKVLFGGWEVPDSEVRARSDEVLVTALPAQIVAAAGDVSYDVIVVTAAGLKTTSPDQLKVV